MVEIDMKFSDYIKKPRKYKPRKPTYIFYADTETVTLTKGKNENLIENSIFENDFKERVEGIEWETAVVNVLNIAVSNIDGKVIKAYNPISFFDKIVKICRKGQQKTCEMYFHNIKFDLFNILDYLHTHDTEGVKYEIKNSLIQGTKWYSVDLMYKGIFIKIKDSLLLTMTSLGSFQKAFGLSDSEAKSKFEFNYEDENLVKRMFATDTELEKYCIQDCICLRAGLNKFFSLLPNYKLTIASTAYADWLNTIPYDIPKDLTLEEQEWANLTYVGGLCYVNPLHKDKIIEKDCVYLDCNSLYPSAALSEAGGYTHYLPFGKGRKTKKVDLDNPKKYYTIKCKLKALVNQTSTIPFLRLGKQYNFGVALNESHKDDNFTPIPELTRKYRQNEMLKYVNEIIFINSIDLRLVYKYYDVIDMEVLDAYEYDTIKGLFDDYIYRWRDVKVQATKDGNRALRQIAKLMLNSLTGKFGQRIEPVKTSVTYDDDGIIDYDRQWQNDKPIEWVYMPIISAILAYSREIFLDMTNSYSKEDFIYCDTDSNIMLKSAFDKHIDKSKIDPTAFGLWDIEYEIKKVKCLRQKCYMFTTRDDEVVIKCAGATDIIKQSFNYDNFVLGATLDDVYQLKPKKTVGGLDLVKTPFKLKEKFLGFN